MVGNVNSPPLHDPIAGTAAVSVQVAIAAHQISAGAGGMKEEEGHQCLPSLASLAV